MATRLVLIALLTLTAAAQDPAGLFETRCATCHREGNVVNAPLPEALRQMSWKAVLDALETGKMATLAATLSPAQREGIAKFIGTADTPPVPTSATCTASPARTTAGDWNGWADPANTRFQPAQAAGLRPADIPRLQVKWAFGYPGAATAFGAVSVVNGALYAGSADGTVYALDARTGCLRWTYEATAGVRAAPSISVDGSAAYFGDLRGSVYALNTATGKLLWRVHAGSHPSAVITGSPKLAAGRLYVPVSGRDESIAAISPNYECCTFRGSVVALDAATGQQVWQAYTIAEEPKETGRNAKGTRTWGPSGAVPWSSPTLDLEKGIVYIGTGVNYSQPPTATSDAVVAVSMDTGRLLWTRQLTTGDAYNFACGADDKTNCPLDPFIDHDFGNSGILRSLAGGKRVLVISDKGGMVYGIDPDRQGQLLWQRKIAAGGVNGGFMWGGASDQQGIAYLGISDFTAGQPETGGGLVALQLSTGETLWKTPAPKPACLGTPGCSAAQPAPVTAIPGAVFLGSWDGHVRAYDSKTGKIVWDFDTLRDFDTVNSVPAHGGSINSVGPVIAGGMLYIGSGYASGTAMAGNVLLAFSIDGK